MLKVGILTYHRSINYGAVLQAVSLRRALAGSLNAQVELIDVVYRKVYKRDYAFALYKRPWSIPYRLLRNRKFESFLNKYGFLSSKLLISDDTEEINYYLQQLDLDYIVVGSDEVWKINSFRPYNSVYWLNNLREVNKVSYAASANGTDFDSVTKDQKSFIRDALKDFICISVRDQQTKQFLISCGCDNEIMLSSDPALLCNIEDYRDDDIRNHFMKTIRYRAKGRKVIGVMVRNPDILHQIYHKYKKECFIVAIKGNTNDSHINFRSLSPLEWINIFYCFDVVCTNFFHGAIISMLHKKPFVVIDAKEEYKKYESKIKYLMKSVGIIDYYFYLHEEGFIWDDVYKVIFDMQYPFEKVDSHVLEARREFRKYIKAIEENEKCYLGSNASSQ